MLNIKKIIDLVVTDTRRAEDDEELLHAVKLAERGALQNPFPIFAIYTESERLPILVDLTLEDLPDVEDFRDWEETRLNLFSFGKWQHDEDTPAEFLNWKTITPKLIADTMRVSWKIG